MIKNVLIISMFSVLTSSARAVDYGVGSLNESDTIYIESSAKLEFIRGSTQHINGSFSLDPDNTAEGVKGALRVDLRTLKTGIDKRDEHMRDNHLHTVKYPYAYFELISVEHLPPQLVFDSDYKLKAVGNFYIHGNYREVEADLKVVRKKLPSGGETLNVVARFDLELDKYKIPRPKALFLKLAENIEIRAVFSGSHQITVQSIELPDWPKLH